MLFERIVARIKPAKETKEGGSLSRRSIRYTLGILLIGLSSIGGLIALRAADPFVVLKAREIAFDLLQRTSPRPYLDAPVKIVDINENSLEQLGQCMRPEPRQWCLTFCS
jgi:CHASE2 domain-containing sensor protein